MGWHFKSPSPFRRMHNPRTLVAILIAVSAFTAWSIEGSRIITALNPTLGRELALAGHPALDVWIAAPDYANATPMIISTPAGVRFEHDTLVVPQGSTVSAHLAEQDGQAPELVVDGESSVFTTDAHGDFAASLPLTSGQKLSIRRGWLTLASWKIKVVDDAAPQIAILEQPTTTDSKNVRLSYRASDAFGVTDVALRILPNATLPGASNSPVEISLPAVSGKEISRIDFEDLTARPWAGQKVTLQLVATNSAGKRGFSNAFEFTVPERSFFHPIARVLIEERRKLLQNPDDQKLRDETANIMAGIAHETGNYHGDPVVLMALRTGAVRLVLDHDHSAATSVNDLLWQAATRIEDGSAGSAERKLRDARQDLANALDHNAGSEEIEMLTGYLQQALDHYVSRLKVHTAATPALAAPKPLRHTSNAQAQSSLLKLQ